MEKADGVMTNAHFSEAVNHNSVVVWKSVFVAGLISKQHGEYTRESIVQQVCI